MAKTVEKELNDLKYLVKEFLKEVQYVPFRAIDCDQESVYTLLNKLIDATGATNDRFGID